MMESFNSESIHLATPRNGSCCQSSNKILKQGTRRRTIPRKWPVVYCCSFAVAIYGILLTQNQASLASGIPAGPQGGPDRRAAGEEPLEANTSQVRQSRKEGFSSDNLEAPGATRSAAAAQITSSAGKPIDEDNKELEESFRGFGRFARGASASPPAPSSSQLVASSSLVEPLRAISGSKSEPPSRPQVDWSKQRPYFGPDMMRNVSVELGKTAYLSCKVFELGDKTVLWLRPRENEILTAGRYTYISDPRFAAINTNGSHDWILEIKDVGLNDSTSYECQISTDPKMSVIINLQVKAAKARIRQGEQYHASIGSNIEFVCEIGQKLAPLHSMSAAQTPAPVGVQQTYWYHNGNLLNYAQRTHAIDKNFSIEWDASTQNSRFKLYNVQLNDAGNYTCKPTSAEPATIRLAVKKTNKSAKERLQHNNGYHSAGSKEAQRNRQHYGLDSSGSSMELNDSSGATSSLVFLRQAKSSINMVTLINCLLASLSLLISHRQL